MPFEVNENSSSESMIAVNNFSDMAFQLWPKLNYETHKEYEKMKKELKVLKK